MRRQNPPQANLENARALEKYLRPITIIPVYAIAGGICVALIALAFAVLLRSGSLSPTQPTWAAFLVIASLSAFAAVAFCVLRPNDPLSAWIKRGANEWRQPVELVQEEFTFKELLGDGDGLRIRMAVYYAKKSRTPEIRERLYLYLKSALGRDCSLRVVIPNFGQVQEAVEPALEIVATECAVPVLYSEVLEIEKIQAAFNFQEGDLASAEFWRTGT